MRRVLSVTVQNVPGVLAHVSGMLASRGYNIASLVAKGTVDPALSRFIFAISGHDTLLKRASEQLQKLATVVDALDINSRHDLECEWHAFTCAAHEGCLPPGARELVDIFRGRIVDIRSNDMLIEISGQERVIEAFVELMRLAGATELTRGGRIAPTRRGSGSQNFELRPTSNCMMA